MKTNDILVRLFTVVLMMTSLNASHAEESNRPAGYPFDVTVADQKAEAKGEYAIVAKVGKPVANDAEVVIPGIQPEMIMVQLTTCDEKGAPTPGAPQKAIMVQSGTKFKLNQTMDKSTLEPGRYLMNVVLRSKGTSRVVFEIK